MKHTIYIIAIAILVLISLTIVLLYYTQDFSEDFEFVNSVNFADIEIQTNNYRNNQETYLTSAKSTIGSLTLENNGYFTQVYTLPQLVGCININEEVSQENLLLRNSRFSTEFNIDGSTLNERYYSYRDSKVNIKVGDEKTFIITGVYNPNNVPLSQFTRENIKSISIYNIPRKQLNPLAEDRRYYNDFRYSNDCSFASDLDLDPVKTIVIN
jgi:hypothetical protein